MTKLTKESVKKIIITRLKKGDSIEIIKANLKIFKQKLKN